MRVSVFITSYNQKKLLREAIESVLNQTRMPDEIVIADDCSTDGSQKLIRQYASSHPDLICPIFQEWNVGIPKNKNDAYRATTGEFVTYLDGDDRFFEDKIATDLKTFEDNPDVDIACANFVYVDVEGRYLGVWDRGNSDVPTGDVSLETLARDFPRCTLFRNEMVRRSKAKRAGFYDPSLSMYEDWDLRIRLTQFSRMAYNPKKTVEYRRNPEGISSGHPGHHLEACKKIYRKHRSLIESLSSESREYVNSNLRPWIGAFAWRAFSSALRRGDYGSAWAYYLDGMRHAPLNAELKAIAKTALPQEIVGTIRSFRNR